MPPHASPLIELRRLVKGYAEKTVLSGIDLEIRRGETVVVIGASGCGKSTLARIVMGLEPPTSGQVLLDGVDLATLDRTSLARAHQRFAMVFQRGALLDSMSVLDNVAFPLREARQLDEDAIRARAITLLRELGVAEALDKLPAQLSGGMAKRVGIARAMVTLPEILIYDEPTAGLDPVSSRIVDRLIERLRERFGVTSIVITHDMVTAYEIADRVVLLAGGSIAAQGAPEEVFVQQRGQIEEFASASAVDVRKLRPRTARWAPERVRELWSNKHA